MELAVPHVGESPYKSDKISLQENGIKSRPLYQ